MSNKPRHRAPHSRESSGSLVLDIPTNDDDNSNRRKPKRRWRFAYAVIYSTRVLRSLAKEIVGKKPHTTLDIDSNADHRPLFDHSPHFANIDHSKLIKIVKEKRLDYLQQLGGIKAIVDALETNIDNGIVPGNDNEEEELKRRGETFGFNTYQKPPPKGFFHFMVEALKDVTIIILLVCASLSLGFGIKEYGIREGWYNGGSIFFAVFLVVAVSAVTNFRQSRQFDELSKVSNNIQVDVVRNGRRRHISIFDVVVGDVVSLKIGDQIPADGLFLNGYSLQVDESSMTGESDYVEIDSNSNPFLLSGAKVADGYARMLVSSVGMKTSWGEMMCSINKDLKEQTPLQIRLDKLTSAIGKIGLFIAFLVLFVLLARYFSGTTKDDRGNREFIRGKTKMDDIFNAMVTIVSDAVTIIVVAIPEGLPLAVTLTLAFSMKRMMREQAMVRKLSACETMGSATIICTDKTGTLTMNQMMVTIFSHGTESGTSNELADNTALDVIELLHQGVSFKLPGQFIKHLQILSQSTLVLQLRKQFLCGLYKN